jgi:hypothetical protein
MTPRKLRNDTDEIPNRIFFNNNIKNPLHDMISLAR